MEGKLTVLLVHNAYRIAGGEDSVVSREKALLEAHGHRVITYFRRNKEMDSLSLKHKVLVPFASLFSLRTYREVKRLIREEHVNVVHVHNTLALISPAVYYAALACRVPVVQTIHNFRFQCPAATFLRDGRVCEECVKHGVCRSLRYGCYRGSRMQTLLCVLNSYLHRHLYHHLHFLCLTDFNRDKLLEMNRGHSMPLITPHRVHVKPNFSESQANMAPPADMPQEPFMVFAARLDESKGVRVLLAAWERLGEKAPRLLLCGTGPLEEECRLAAERLPRITLRGFVPNAELRSLLPHAIALVLPTQWYEGFPVTIAEAYAAGIPVLGSAIGNVGALVSTYGGISFDQNSPESLAAAVQECLVHPPTLHRAAIAPLLSAEENYKLLAAIYDKALADRS